jgi:hypothetical protein
MINPKEDGVTHVNIYSQGKTQLGKFLSNFYGINIRTKDGMFYSVEAYWYWLGIEDCDEKEVLRSLSGYEAKKIGNELKKKHKARVDEEFENKILKAIWYKVRNNSYILGGRFAELPFEHYYNFGGKVVDVKDKYLWMIEGIDKMRKHILTERMIDDVQGRR